GQRHRRCGLLHASTGWDSFRGFAPADLQRAIRVWVGNGTHHGLAAPWRRMGLLLCNRVQRLPAVRIGNEVPRDYPRGRRVHIHGFGFGLTISLVVAVDVLPLEPLCVNRAPAILLM